MKLSAFALVLSAITTTLIAASVPQAPSPHVEPVIDERACKPPSASCVKHTDCCSVYCWTYPNGKRCIKPPPLPRRYLLPQDPNPHLHVETRSPAADHVIPEPIERTCLAANAVCENDAQCCFRSCLDDGIEKRCLSDTDTGVEVKIKAKRDAAPNRAWDAAGDPEGSLPNRAWKRDAVPTPNRAWSPNSGFAGLFNRAWKRDAAKALPHPFWATNAKTGDLPGQGWKRDAASDTPRGSWKLKGAGEGASKALPKETWKRDARKDAPKGTWLTKGSETDLPNGSWKREAAGDAPKGGWVAKGAVDDLPKGGWKRDNAEEERYQAGSVFKPLKDAPHGSWKRGSDGEERGGGRVV